MIGRNRHRLPAMQLALLFVTMLWLLGCHQMAPNNARFEPESLASNSSGRPSAGTKPSLQIASTEPEGELTAIAKLEQKGRGTEAVYAYQQLIAEGKATATVYQRLATLLDRQGKFDQSSKYFLAALQTEPENAEILCDYGYSRFVQGDLATAEATLRTATERNPGLARAHNNLALVLTRLERTEEALEQFRLAGANDEQAQRNLQVAATTTNGQ